MKDVSGDFHEKHFVEDKATCARFRWKLPQATTRQIWEDFLSSRCTMRGGCLLEPGCLSILED